MENKNIVYVKNIKPTGSVGWFIFWILICWPVAIVYYFSRDWTKKVWKGKHEKES